MNETSDTHGVKRILEGEVIDTVLKEIEDRDTSATVSLALSNPSTQDSAFREWVEQENAFTLNQGGADLGIPQLISPLEALSLATLIM